MFFLSGEARACGISHPGRMFDKLPAEFYNKLVALPLGFETKRAEQPEGDESMTAAKKRIPAFSPLLKKIFRFVSMTLATLMLVALFYLAVVLGQPQEPENPITVSQDQPLLAASPALNIQSERQISTLSETFPVPILAFMEGMGPTLQSGTSYDLAFENGFARLTELTYTTDNSLTFTLTTIYPARALSLLKKGDYTLAGAAAQNLTGYTAVRMEDKDHIRLHAQASDAVYVLTVPQMSDESLSAVTRVLQLVSPGESGSL